jgi:glycosyltransferase involved in cell wall biosynthesis
MTDRRPLRILMLCPQYRPVLGGYERAAERLSIGLARHGHAVTVITERIKRAWPRRETLDGVDVRRLWCLPYRGVQTMSALWSLAWFLALPGRRYDVWHAHQYGIRTAIAIVIGKIVGRPVVLKLTSTGRLGLADSLDRERLRRFVRARHREVDAVVAITRETRDEALRFGIPPERIHQFGNAVDTADFRPPAGDDKRSARQAVGLDAAGVALYVGRLIPQKNPRALLESWARACGEMPGWQLHMLGDGQMAAELREMIDRLRIDSCTFLHGPQRNVSAWLAAADIYVMPSILEGLSNSLLEAMASSLPTVCTQVSGVEELIAEPGAGIVLPQGDVDGFARALVKLAADSNLRNEMGRIARHVVEARFSIDVIAGQHARLYDRLIAEKRMGASRPRA